MSIRIGAKLAKLHQTQVPGAVRHPNLWDKIRHWLQQAKEIYPDFVMPIDGINRTISLFDIEAETILLEEELAKLRSPCVFCHNDLNPENIIFDPSTNTLSFIDFEYASYNYRGFDLGNHFCEWAGVAVNLDFDTFYPTREQQLPFLQAYLQESNAEKVVDDQLEDLLDEVNKFAMASHLFWGLWGIVQHRVSEVGCDFMNYTLKRLTAYFLRRASEDYEPFSMLRRP